MAGTIITLSSILCDKLNVPMVHCAILLDRSRSRSPGGGGGAVLPIMAYMGKFRPTRYWTRYVKGVPFFNRGYTKGVPFSWKMVYKTGKGLDVGAEPPFPAPSPGSCSRVFYQTLETLRKETAPGCRETKWSRVCCRRKQRDGMVCTESF